MEIIKRSVAAGGGRGGIYRQSPVDFQGSENILYDTMMMGTCHHTFIQTHRMDKAKEEP